MPSPTPCRVVTLEWDRGHESLDAVVRAESEHGVIVTEVIDFASASGLRWIRREEILQMEDYNPDLAVVRLADLRGTRVETVDPSLTELPVLLQHLQRTDQLVGVYRERTGSDELLVGEIIELTAALFHIRDVDSKGRYDGEVTEYALDEVIRIDWGSTYLTALTELLRAHP